MHPSERTGTIKNIRVTRVIRAIKILGLLVIRGIGNLKIVRVIQVIGNIRNIWVIRVFRVLRVDCRSKWVIMQEIVMYQVELVMDYMRYFIQDHMDCRTCEILSVMLSAGSLRHSESGSRAHTKDILHRQHLDLH
jgi:hypothetical protein